MSQQTPRETIQRAERFEVRMLVRFERAQGFVEEYAHNLSEGGLFIAGATSLEPLQEVHVTLDLPGRGVWSVGCRVAHVRGTDVATDARPAGAGLAILESPAGFDDVLRDYLRILGRRRDAVVLAAPGAAADLLGAAGFQVEPLPPLEEAIERLILDSFIVAILTPTNVDDYLALVESFVDTPPIVRSATDLPDDQLLNLLDQAVEDRLTRAEHVA